MDNVSENFKNIIKSITPNEEDNESVKKRYNFIGKSLSDSIVFDKRKFFFLSGANRRLTQIRPITELDLMIVLDFDEYFKIYSAKPHQLFKYLKSEVDKIYLNVKSRIQIHSIRLLCETGPKVDLIPAFLINEKEEIYSIPNNKFRKFVLTSPPKNRKIIARHDRNLNKKFKPLIRILKKWRDKNGVFMTSFHLEVLAMNLVKKQFSNYQEGLNIFFKGASKKIFKPCKDPANLSGDLSYYLNYDNKVRLFKYFSSMHIQIRKLLKLEGKGKQKQAIEGWNNLLIGKKSLENN